MLRISRMDCEDGSVYLKLEGRLIGEWVELLRETCQRHQQEIGTPLILDLSAVGFANWEGLRLLRHLEQEGVCCMAWSPYMRTLSQTDRSPEEHLRGQPFNEGG